MRRENHGTRASKNRLEPRPHSIQFIIFPLSVHLASLIPRKRLSCGHYRRSASRRCDKPACTHTAGHQLGRLRFSGTELHNPSALKCNTSSDLTINWFGIEKHSFVLDVANLLAPSGRASANGFQLRIIDGNLSNKRPNRYQFNEFPYNRCELRSVHRTESYRLCFKWKPAISYRGLCNCGGEIRLRWQRHRMTRLRAPPRGAAPKTQIAHVAPLLVWNDAQLKWRERIVVSALEFNCGSCLFIRKSWLQRRAADSDARVSSEKRFSRSGLSEAAARWEMRPVSGLRSSRARLFVCIKCAVVG